MTQSGSTTRVISGPRLERIASVGFSIAMRYARSICAAVLTVLLFAGEARPTATTSRSSLCLMLESAARANGIPTAFLVRGIWRESRFDPHAIGPRTRSGAHAQGIAQFMATTAAERALANPFDPVQALPKAAEFLRELRDEFGNLGLAAAAYNAGPGRIRGWLDGGRTLPDETQRYVQAITGRSAADWAKVGNVSMVTPEVDCLELVASLEQGPSRFFCELEKRITAAIGQPLGCGACGELFPRPCACDIFAAYGQIVRFDRRA